tara:strand:+ start:2134 stop:2292 length:159 start_codon:yes stop_codon:yes gene_type:complete
MQTLKEIQKETARKAREGYMREVQNKADRKAAGIRAEELAKLWKPVNLKAER